MGESTVSDYSTISSIFYDSTDPTNIDNVTAFINFTITKTSQKVQLALYDYMIPGLGALVILLNLAVVISSGLILKKGSEPRTTYLFLGNVALSDLVTGIAIILGQTYPKHLRSQLNCAFQLGLIVSSTVVSIYSVGLIAIDRYLYIVHGLKYQRWVYPMRARILIGITWVIGCIVGFLPVMGWAGDTYDGRYCWFIKLVPPKLIVMTCLIGFIPILVVVILYSIILYHAIKKVIQLKSADQQTTAKGENDLRMFRGKNNTEVPPQQETEQEKSFFKRFIKKPKTVDKKKPSKSKAVKIVFLTTGSFIITWVPYFVTAFIYVNCDENITPEKCKSLRVLIASPLAILGFCNSLLNPIIYAWWHRGFRNFVKKMILKNKPTRKIPTSSGGTEKSNDSRKASTSTSNEDTKMTELPGQNSMENINLR